MHALHHVSYWRLTHTCVFVISLTHTHTQTESPVSCRFCMTGSLRCSGHNKERWERTDSLTVRKITFISFEFYPFLCKSKKIWWRATKFLYPPPFFLSAEHDECFSLRKGKNPKTLFFLFHLILPSSTDVSTSWLNDLLMTLYLPPLLICHQTDLPNKCARLSEKPKKQQLIIPKVQLWFQKFPGYRETQESIFKCPWGRPFTPR